MVENNKMKKGRKRLLTITMRTRAELHSGIPTLIDKPTNKWHHMAFGGLPDGERNLDIPGGEKPVAVVVACSWVSVLDHTHTPNKRWV